MIIGIDGNEANVDNRVGIGEYAFELLQQFSRFKTHNLEFVIYLKNKPKRDMPSQTAGWSYRVIGPKKLWTQIGLPISLFKDRPRPDVFFSPTHYAPRFSTMPVVISIMDLSYIYFPEMFKAQDLYQLRSWTAYSAKRAKRILTISKSSKNDIIKVYKIPPERVVVTYPGVKLKSQNSKFKMTTENSKLIKEKYGINGEYILFVGTLQPRKNLVRLIEAHSILVSKYPNISLVIVGKKGWLYEEIMASPKKFGIENKVKFLDFVADSDLSLLYQNAQFFVLPSLYEGFGLPVLEAMKNGCPVVISNVSSLPEAGGDAAIYVDPDDVGDIAAKMQELILNSKLRKELIAKGYQQVKKFSWEKTAKETLRVLEEVVKV